MPQLKILNLTAWSYGRGNVLESKIKSSNGTEKLNGGTILFLLLSLSLSTVIAGDSWYFFHWERSAKKQGEVIMLTKPKRRHEQCMSLSHSQVWRGFKEEDRIICKQGINTKTRLRRVIFPGKLKWLIKSNLFPQRNVYVYPISFVNNSFSCVSSCWSG